MAVMNLNEVVIAYIVFVLSVHYSTITPSICQSRSRASRVEQFSSRSPSAEHFAAGVQETTENVSVLG